MTVKTVSTSVSVAIFIIINYTDIIQVVGNASVFRKVIVSISTNKMRALLLLLVILEIALSACNISNEIFN